MVANSVVIISVAKLSAELWQHIACLPEHVSSEQLLDLVCCFPLEQLGRLALCLWTFFCLPPSPDTYYYYYDSDDESESSSLSSMYYVDDRGHGSRSDWFDCCHSGSFLLYSCDEIQKLILILLLWLRYIWLKWVPICSYWLHMFVALVCEFATSCVWLATISE